METFFFLSSWLQLCLLFFLTWYVVTMCRKVVHDIHKVAQSFEKLSRNVVKLTDTTSTQIDDLTKTISTTPKHLSSLSELLQWSNVYQEHV